MIAIELKGVFTMALAMALVMVFVLATVLTMAFVVASAMASVISWQWLGRLVLQCALVRFLAMALKGVFTKAL